MGKFRKKPVEIEAVQFVGVDAIGVIDFGQKRPAWLVAAQQVKQGEPGRVWLIPGYDPAQLMISTLEGDHRAQPGDWIIRGIKGELYPCKPDIFAATYDKVS